MAIWSAAHGRGDLYKTGKFVWNFGIFYNLRICGFLRHFWFLPLKILEKYEGYSWRRFDQGKELFVVRGIGGKRIGVTERDEDWFQD
jgi:hypothetical protein